MIEENLKGRPNPSVLRLLDAVDDVDGFDPCDDAILLAHVRHKIDLLLADCAGAITEEDLYEPCCSPVQWLRYEANLPTGVAMTLVGVGQGGWRLRQTVEAVDAGEIGFSHLSLMAEACGRLDEAFDEAQLLQKAREQTVTDFRKTVEHAVHAAYPERFVEEEREGREHRFLKLSAVDNGSVWLKGWIDPEGASFVRSALEHLARKDGADDDRNREQRLGDALVEMASAGVQTELIVTVPLETLVAAQGAPAAETEWGGIVSANVVRRLLCDARVRRLVLDGDGQVVDFGRARRLFKGNARRALAGRDGHCVFPGCDRPGRWCDGHHLKAYARGGPTDLDNGVLLCGRHHRLCDDGWTLVWDGKRFTAIAPRRWPPDAPQPASALPSAP